MGKVIKGLISPISLAPKAVQAAALVAIGVATGNPQLVVMGISIGLSKVSAMLGPKTPKSQFSRLSVSLDPSTPRKAVLGTTAMNLDLRYHEVSGTDQEFADYIIALAAHEVNSIDEIWFDDKQAWTSGGGVTATYSGYLTVTPREVGTSGNTISINGGTKWGSSRRLTGCAYLHLRIRRTGVSKKTESPLVNGLPTRVTVIGDGALLYDPRRDSTVAGGSGLHRVNDQATWGNYTAADDTDNPALQLLWFLLGWRINGELSIGCGIPASRIDIPSFIAAANVCDENVTLAIGGTQKRYRTSGTFSDADDRMELIQSLLSCMNGTLRDSNGKLAVEVLKNDLADYVIDFDDHDIIGDFEWQQTGGLDQVYNVARGRYVDPSNNSLYQTVEYPEVSVASLDGIERELPFDLPFVEDGRRAQRLTKQILQRSQYQGRFTATFKAKALGCSIGEVVRLSFEPLGWSNKLFRVVEQEVRFDGLVPLVLLEENAAIYAWDSEDSAPITPTAPTVYDPLNSPFILGAEEAAQSATWANITGTGGQPTGATVASAITTDGLIAPDAVVESSINVPLLSGISANVGTLTAGVIQSASGNAKFDLDAARIIFNNGTVMKVTGLGFGSSSQFLEWYGPTQANLSTCTEANGSYYLKTDGTLFWGGATGGNDYGARNLVFGMTSPSSPSPGTYAPNGSPIIITPGATTADLGTSSVTGASAFAGDVNVSYKWQHSTNGSSWTDVGAAVTTTLIGNSNNAILPALNRTATGLTAGVLAYFRIVLQVNSYTGTGSRTIFMSSYAQGG
jgi:hypothetical protein